MSAQTGPSVAGATIATTFLPALIMLMDIYHKGFGADCTERTAVDAGAALDTLIFIDLAYAILVVGNRVYRASLLTRALQMCDRVVRAGILRTCRTPYTCSDQYGHGYLPC